MSTAPSAWLAWSSGKDAAMALHELRRTGEVRVVGLLTTVTESFGRVSMHGVREAILRRQAEAIGLPLTVVSIPAPCPNEVYEEHMARGMDAARSEGVTHVVFGDLFLEDVREYRQRQLARAGMEAVFPLWGRSTGELAREILDAGFDAFVTCVDPAQAPAALAGRRYDRALLDELPDGVDPCGENGEFHTCVVGGPGFDRPLAVRPGERVERDGFVFADLLLADEPEEA